MSKQRTITVEPYNTNWPNAFASEQQKLQRILGNVALSIEHIGSTAVPQLAAKPIIDMLLEVTSVIELEHFTEQLAAIGYVAKGENGITGRRYFQKGNSARTHHLHAFAVGSEQLVRHRAFRDYLKAHAPIAVEYAQIKRQAARQCQQSSAQYQALKAEFIQYHQQLALQWYKA